MAPAAQSASPNAPARLRRGVAAAIACRTAEHSPAARHLAPGGEWCGRGRAGGEGGAGGGAAGVARDHPRSTLAPATLRTGVPWRRVVQGGRRRRGRVTAARRVGAGGGRCTVVVLDLPGQKHCGSAVAGARPRPSWASLLEGGGCCASSQQGEGEEAPKGLDALRDVPSPRFSQPRPPRWGGGEGGVSPGALPILCADVGVVFGVVLGVVAGAVFSAVIRVVSPACQTRVPQLVQLNKARATPAGLAGHMAWGGVEGLHSRVPLSRQRQNPRRRAEQRKLQHPPGHWPRCGPQKAAAPDVFFSGKAGRWKAPAKERGAAIRRGTVHPSAPPRCQTAPVLPGCAGAAKSTGAERSGSGRQAVSVTRRPAEPAAGRER